MTPPPPRDFFLPTIGLILLFAAFGPAIGGALFVPLAFLLEAPPGANAVWHFGGIAMLIGNALALIPAYIVGIGPAAATGFVYALWDAWAPRSAPRALAGAFIGGAMSYGVVQWLASLGAGFETSVSVAVSQNSGSWVYDVVSGEFAATLRTAFVACGAVAGFVCAMAASLLGLTTQAPLAPSEPPGGA